MFKLVFSIMGGIILLILLIFGAQSLDLFTFKFFAPKYENVKREVFEETKSYVHGKIQDLTKYFEEYSKANTEGKEAIRQIVIMNFAEFDPEKIQNEKLKQFLINVRGY